MERAALFLLALITSFVALSWGLPRNNGIGRIVGGQDAPAGMFPHMVSLRDFRNRHSCGGCIISSRTILTAAHCIEGARPEGMTVAAGSVRLDSGEKRYAVSRFIVHPDSDSYDFRHDVGLIVLAEAVAFDNFTRPVDAGTEELGAGLEVTLSGWGTTTYPGAIPNHLQYMTLRTVTVSLCAERYAPIDHAVYEDQLCTMNGPGQGMCHFDSGSPIVFNGKVVGVASWVYACAFGYPDVFARISSYYDWIEANKV